MITSTADLFIVNVTTIVRVLEVAKAEVVDNWRGKTKVRLIWSPSLST